MVTRRQANSGILASAALAAVPAFAATQKLKPIELPTPRSEGGLPLINALKLRHSTREFSDRPLPPQTLSDLLWAAFGINRPSGFRTAPCGRYIIAIEIYGSTSLKRTPCFRICLATSERRPVFRTS